MKKTRYLLLLAALFGFGACTSIDCSLDSVVVWTLTFYDSESDEPVKLLCDLTVDAAGAGTLFNRGSNITSVELPMSHNAPTDTLFLRWSLPDDGDTETPEDYAANDVVYIDHDNYGHFDAMDCPGAVFHTITDVRHEPRGASSFPLYIDSISIIRPQVDYNDVENIRIYLRSSAASRHRVAEPGGSGRNSDGTGSRLYRPDEH